MLMAIASRWYDANSSVCIRLHSQEQAVIETAIWTVKLLEKAMGIQAVAFVSESCNDLYSS